jgi:hypothetical protein
MVEAKPKKVMHLRIATLLRVFPNHLCHNNLHLHLRLLEISPHSRERA